MDVLMGNSLQTLRMGLQLWPGLASCFSLSDNGCSDGYYNCRLLQGYGKVCLPLQAKVYTMTDNSAKHGVSLHAVEYLLHKHSITKEIRVLATQVCAASVLCAFLLKYPHVCACAPKKAANHRVARCSGVEPPVRLSKAKR
jgi:hypothetical protein